MRKNLLKLGILIVVFSFCLIKVGNIAQASEDAFDYYIQGMDFLIENTAEKNEEAIESLQKAIELDPEMSDAYLELAAAYAQKYRYFDQDNKWYNLAIEQLGQAKSIDPYAYESVVGHAVLAQLYFAKGEFDKAKEECERMIELEPKYETAYLMLGEINESLGETQQAAEAYETASDLDPSLEEAKEKAEELREEAEELEKGVPVWLWIIIGLVSVGIIVAVVIIVIMLLIKKKSTSLPKTKNG